MTIALRRVGLDLVAVVLWAVYQVSAFGWMAVGLGLSGLVCFVIDAAVLVFCGVPLR